MNCLRSILDVAVEDNSVNHRCIFQQGDIRNAKKFDPFTHVYMFSIGFPPALWIELAEIWNQSTSSYMICFHSPKDIIDCYEFDVEILAKTPTSMHGSKEGHTGYVYRRKSRKSLSAYVDPLFTDGIEKINGGLRSLRDWTATTLDEKISSRPSTRARRGVMK